MQYEKQLLALLLSTDEKSIAVGLEILRGQSQEKYEQLIAQGIIADGMLPKMHNCFNSLKKGVSKVKIGDASLVKSTNNIYTTLTI